MTSEQDTARPHLPRLATVENEAKAFAEAGQTPLAIRGNIFKMNDRTDKNGKAIKGNGLGATGAIIRRGARIYVDLDRYGAWLAGR